MTAAAVRYGLRSQSGRVWVPNPDDVDTAFRELLSSRQKRARTDHRFTSLGLRRRLTPDIKRGSSARCAALTGGQIAEGLGDLAPGYRITQVEGVWEAGCQAPRRQATSGAGQVPDGDKCGVRAVGPPVISEEVE